MKRLSGPARGGYSLVELALATAILTIVLGSLTLFGRRSAQALRSGTAQADLDARLRNTVVRVTRELLPSGFRVLVPAATADRVDYRKADSVANGTLVWGVPQRLAFEYEAGELDDGLDNNQDGFVDEGMVVWTIDPGQPGELRTVLCHGVREHPQGEIENELDDNGDGLVDERGLSFEREGEALRIRLTLEGRDPEGRALVRTLETGLQPRN